MMNPCEPPFDINPPGHPWACFNGKEYWIINDSLTPCWTEPGVCTMGSYQPAAGIGAYLALAFACVVLLGVFRQAWKGKRGDERRD